MDLHSSGGVSRESLAMCQCLGAGNHIGRSGVSVSVENVDFGALCALYVGTSSCFRFRRS